jgi:chromosome segregation ATPase
MKNNFLSGTVLFLCFISISGFPQRAYPQGAAKDGCEQLKKEYDTLLADRDNILAQTKSLLESKNKYDELEAKLQKVSADLAAAQKDLQARIEQNSLLKQQVDDLESAQAQLTQENGSLKNSLEKIKIEYKIIPETRQEITRLQKENTDTLKSFKQLQEKIKGLEDAKIDAYAQAETYRRQLNDFKKRYEQALAKNRSLEKKIAQLPSRFAELARENKVLVKETALMHYNLGVFYTQGKEYSRGIAEFEKAVELNPDDPYAYYNLGYIYAEYVVDRPKAIDNFRQFLRRAKSEDKDVDWVKKYILTWQTWESKKPVE